MGVEIPPPHFISFILNMLINGVFFGALWGVFMWNFFWSSKGKAGIDAIEISASAGLTFGIIMAVQYEFGKRKYKLPSWKSFGEN